MRRFAGYIMNTFIITFIFLIKRGMYHSNTSFFFLDFVSIFIVSRWISNFFYVFAGKKNEDSMEKIT